MKDQFSIPDQGSKVEITFVFPSYVIGSPKVSQTTITGIVEKATKFTPPDFVRLATDFETPVRIREIPLERITNIKYVDGSIAVRQIKSENKSWTVPGSKGNTYNVVNNRNSWSCTCTGFQFRRNCKHIQSIQT